MKKFLILLLAFPFMAQAETLLKVTNDTEIDLDSVKQNQFLLKKSLANGNYAMLLTSFDCKKNSLNTLSTHFYNQKGINYKTINNEKVTPLKIGTEAEREVVMDIVCYKEIRNELKMIVQEKMMD